MAKREKRPVRVGDRIRVWWNTGVVENGSNVDTVLAVLPYTGRYPKLCDCVLRLPSTKCYRGWVEMAYHSSDLKYDSA